MVESVKISWHGKSDIVGDSAKEILNEFIIRNRLAGRFWIHSESEEDWFIELLPYCISCKIELRGGNIDDLKQNISLIHSSKVIIDDENTKIIYQMMLDCAKNEVQAPD